MIFDLNTLLKTFQDLPEIIETYSKNIPGELLDRKRSDTAWTIREHIYHICSVQEMLYQRMLKIKNEENPVITPFFPENEPVSELPYNSLQEAFAHYKELRKKQISLIRQLSKAELDKEARHDEYTRYSIPVILNHMIFHEYWHMYRLEEVWLARDEFFS